MVYLFLTIAHLSPFLGIRNPETDFMWCFSLFHLLFIPQLFLPLNSNCFYHNCRGQASALERQMLGSSYCLNSAGVWLFRLTTHLFLNPFTFYPPINKDLTLPLTPFFFFSIYHTIHFKVTFSLSLSYNQWNHQASKSHSRKLNTVLPVPNPYCFYYITL